MTTYTVDQALEILHDNEITSSIQVVRRWLREGKLNGISHGNKRKEGWRIDKTSLDAFIAMKKANVTVTMGVQESRSNDKMLRAEIEALKAENEKLRAQNMMLLAVNEELRTAAPRLHSGIISEPHELTKDEVETLWTNSRDRGRYLPHIQQRAFESLFRLLFRDGSNITNLYNSKYKNPYVCPNSGIKYKSADRLVFALIPRLLTWKVNEEKQIAELTQLREDDFRIYRGDISRTPSAQLARMFQETAKNRLNDKKEFFKRNAIVDVLVERGGQSIIDP